MSNNPKVSVVIPAYNVECYLPECLESIYKQTLSDFEVIVVDDASTDETRGAAVRVENAYGRLRYFRNETNQGSAATRNFGIKEARAEIIAFLDGDDRWYPEFLETLLRVLENNPDVHCAFCDFDFIDETSLVTDAGTGRYPSEESPQLCRVSTTDIWTGRGPMPGSSMVMFRRAELLDTGLFPSGYCEDINLWLRFSVKYNFAEVGVILSSYRRHQLQKTASANAYRFLLARTEAYIDAAQAHPQVRQLIGPRLFAEVMHGQVTAAGDYWFWAKQDYARAAGYFRKAWRFKPLDTEILIKLLWCWTPESMRRVLRTTKAAIRRRGER
jgi:glycosyltransferase involved in cell wall biosynthesis